MFDVVVFGYILDVTCVFFGLMLVCCCFFVLDGFVLMFFAFGRKGMLRIVFILKWGFARSIFLVAGPLNPVFLAGFIS